MKKVLALMLALVLVLSLVACGGGDNANSNSGENEDDTSVDVADTSTTKVSLGETVSTDIVDFTLKKAELSYYASALHDKTYAEPIDKSDGGIFSSAKGRVLVCMTFSIKNNDRNYIDAGGYFPDWGMYFKIVYNGNEYSVNGFDLNEKDGRSGLGFGESEISYNGGTSFTQNTSGNIIIEEGRTVTVKVVGIAKFDPDSLNDSFDLVVNIPNSDDNDEYFTYEVK